MNFKYAFAADPQYKQNLITVLKDTAITTPMILIFSLFIAVILNQEFKGRGFARAIFFLPVIIATGPVYNIISGDIASTGADSGAQFSTLFETDIVDQLLEFVGVMNISAQLSNIINSVVTNIFGLVWSSGIQILIFLAALQNIPVSAKEAASMEGATAWEYFWKITLPYVSPMILANFIYTVIDCHGGGRHCCHDHQQVYLLRSGIRGCRYGFGKQTEPRGFRGCCTAP